MQLVASTTRLDFGAVAVGSRAVQELVLRNESQTATTFQVGATPAALSLVFIFLLFISHTVPYSVYDTCPPVVFFFFPSSFCLAGWLTDCLIDWPDPREPRWLFPLYAILRVSRRPGTVPPYFRSGPDLTGRACVWSP